MKNPEYSIVVPVFNSQEGLEELYSEISEVFQNKPSDFEVIFVDDGSIDTSWETLKNIQKENIEHVRIVKLSRNYGQHNATLCGLNLVKGQTIITIDDDMQWPPSEIPLLIDAYKQSGNDVVYAVPQKDKKHSGIRNSGSKLVKRTSRRFRKTKGDGSSFRIMSRKIADSICEHRLHFIFIDEIIHWYTDSIGFIKLKHKERKYKTSGYTFVKLFSMTANLVFFYTGFPLKLMVYGGFLASFISFVVGIIYIVKKLFWDVPLGYTSLIVAILFSTSIILFSLGIIGEYLRRMYVVQNKKPPFHIQRIIESACE